MLIYRIHNLSGEFFQMNIIPSKLTRFVLVRTGANSAHIPLTEHSVLREPAEQTQRHQRQHRKSQNQTW
jgi:hypothetical protein